KYRSLDGTCNNLYRPLIGRAFTPFSRFLTPQYGDGVQSLRLSRDGSPLPEARRVSFSIAESKSVPHHVNTLMLMQWGQFLDHDLTLTAISKIATDPTCAPIKIPSDDPSFFGKQCLEFVRSQEVPNLNCTLGPREQLNQITSYIDASNVYGSTVEDANGLRDLSNPRRGKLLQSVHPQNDKLKKLLPTTKENAECNKHEPGKTCFHAGDERVNEQSALTVLHTVWLREHNRIEQELFKMNPHWNGKTLFEETRRIVGAMMQHVTFNEFLPIVLGTKSMERHGLNLLQQGFYSGYRNDVDPSIRNSFATAAFRFGHTLIPKSFDRFNESWSTNSYPSLDLSTMFFQPQHAFDTKADGVDGMARGLCDQNIESFDRFVVPQVTVHLFSQSPPNGLGTDLVALNIQRARDHGIPGYNHWRQWCGLSRAADFDSLVDIADPAVRSKLRRVYRHVDDIDLFAAGISERPVEGGLVGPTFACIIGEQFKNLRQGDRFWYENTGAFSFSTEQLQELRKVTLAKVLCNNSDNISTIQPKVMERP
ncbi:hypothetical protein CAPTEDRAFT_72445, partial [Capitella teleta]|uniref:Uncharacterized protein n=1 Tax=Capitella teleta TaxID=283909 RepID=X2B8C2_CAPTE